jgi:hypothetical protein
MFQIEKRKHFNTKTFEKKIKVNAKHSAHMTNIATRGADNAQAVRYCSQHSITVTGGVEPTSNWTASDFIWWCGQELYRRALRFLYLHGFRVTGCQPVVVQ